MSDSTKKGIATVAAIILVGFAISSIWGSFGDEVQKAANTRTYMDKDSGKLFRVELKEGTKSITRKNPDTGEMTLYPTEVCYRNDCRSEGGTHVILNKLLKESGPTHCPKCGALVVFHNPRPRGEATSPTLEEIVKRAKEGKGD